MFGRTVTVDGHSVFVFCTPDTPMSEVLARASRKLEREEKETRDAKAASYHKAIRELAQP